MEPEGSSPHLQQPATWSYPEPEHCLQYSDSYIKLWVLCLYIYMYVLNAVRRASNLKCVPLNTKSYQLKEMKTVEQKYLLNFQSNFNKSSV
jgi:hypothetical protein